MEPGRALGVLWLVWLLSWILAAGWSNTTKSRQSGIEQLKYSVFIWAGTILIFAHPTFLAPLLHPIYPPMAALDWSAIGIVLIGLSWAWWARIHLGRMWSSAVTLKESHALIRTGPYRLTRHPIYTGLLLALLASATLEDSWAAVLGFALIVVGVVLKLRQEERVLSAAFGPQYATYRTEVPALIPRPW